MTRIFIAIAAILFGFSSAARALENTSVIEILGSDNQTRVDQRGTADNMSTVKQDGAGNSAFVDQFTANPFDKNENTSYIEQIGDSHKVQVTQEGAGNINNSEIILSGNSNEVKIRQYEQFNDNLAHTYVTSGSHNIVSVTQGGTGNTSSSTITIGGNNNNAWVSQH
jgi:hypothetical protein